MDVKKYLIVVLMFISLKTSNAEHLPVFWLFIYHLCQNAYLSPLPVFESGCLIF
jgi:hypothetical protein